MEIVDGVGHKPVGGIEIGAALAGSDVRAVLNKNALIVPEALSMEWDQV